MFEQETTWESPHPVSADLPHRTSRSRHSIPTFLVEFGDSEEKAGETKDAEVMTSLSVGKILVTEDNHYISRNHVSYGLLCLQKQHSRFTSSFTLRFLQSKLRICSIRAVVLDHIRLYSFKSEPSPLHTGMRINVGLFEFFIQYQFRSRPKAERIMALPPPANHQILERPQEMKKLEDAFNSQKKLEDAFGLRSIRKMPEQVSVVYLKGEPGVGKTQLARKYAKKHGKSTVATIDMTDFIHNYHKVAAKICVDSNLANGQRPEEVAQLLRESLVQRKEWLLIIDNYNSDVPGVPKGMCTLEEC